MTKDSTVAAHHRNKVGRPYGEWIGLGQRHDELVLLTIEGDPGTGEGKRRTNGITINVVAEYSSISANNDDPILPRHDEPVGIAVEGDPRTGAGNGRHDMERAQPGLNAAHNAGESGWIQEVMSEHVAVPPDHKYAAAEMDDEPVVVTVECDP
jgi:hypothetical protein